MNDQFLIYLWCISENIKEALIFLACFGGILGFVVCGFITSAILDKYLPKYYIAVWIIPIFCLLCGFTTVLIPSKQDLALIWAYPTVKQDVVNVVNNKQVRSVPDKVLKLANKYLDEELKK